MRRLFRALAFTFFALGSVVPVVSGDEVLLETRWSMVELGAKPPADLLSPEGMTLWDLTGVTVSGKRVRAISRLPGDGGALQLDERVVGPAGPTRTRRTYTDPAGGDAAERWLVPHIQHAYLDGSGGEPLVIEQHDGDRVRHLWIRVERLGRGWLHLPTGPRRAVLQRALILAREEGSRAWVPEEFLYRWVDPRAGVVAEVAGAPSADGERLESVESAAVVEQVMAGGSGLQITVGQHEKPIYSRLNMGWDLGSGTSISELCPTCADIGDLVCCGGDATCRADLAAGLNPDCPVQSWDFSGIDTSGAVETASTLTHVCNDVGGECETCSYDKCGFSEPDVYLAREDKNFGDPFTISAQEREDRLGAVPPDVTVWMRAAVRAEGESSMGAFENESRLCHVGGGRTEVPLYRFSHPDPGNPADPDKFFMQEGDAWGETDTFDCELIIYAHVCPSDCPAFLCQTYAAPCDDHTGTTSNRVINEGTITLPSGHTFEALLIRNVADFCTYQNSGCSTLFQFVDVRNVIYFWVVPELGTVARLTSATEVADTHSFTELKETDFKFGLFPPRSITVGTVDDTSVQLSWDPGSDTHRIDGYKVRWGLSSGGYTDEATVATTSTTISGLTSNTQYFFTVTSLYTFTDPYTSVARTYESLVFPTQIDDDGTSIPQEVSATTTGGACTPTQEIAGLTVDRVAPDIEICWEPSGDPCVDGYQILSAASPESATNFSVDVADTGLSTCHAYSTTSSYFLVVGKGTGGTGPWGHFGQ